MNLPPTEFRDEEGVWTAEGWMEEDTYMRTFWTIRWAERLTNLFMLIAWLWFAFIGLYWLWRLKVFLGW